MLVRRKFSIVKNHALFGVKKITFCKSACLASMYYVRINQPCTAVLLFWKYYFIWTNYKNQMKKNTWDFDFFACIFFPKTGNQTNYTKKCNNKARY